MRKLFVILFFIPLLCNGQYEVKPDVKPMFRSLYEVKITLDSLATFTVAAHDLDTAIVTAVGFPPRATNYQLRYLQGLSYPSISTGTLALSNPDSSQFKGFKVKIDVPADNTNYAFRLFSTGVDTVSNSDTTQLDLIPSSPDFFAGGIVWVEGTDTTQFDSIYTSGSALNFESDGILISIDSIGTGGCVGCITEMQTYYDAMTTPWTGDTITKMNDFFDSIDANSYLANAHLIYWFGGHKDDDGDALINVANPGTYNGTNGTGGAAATLSYGGYQGDGGDSILTNYNPNTATLGQNAATVIVYLKIDQQEANSYIYYASDGNHIRMLARSGGDAGSWIMNATLSQNDGMTDADGLWINTRRAASGANAIEAYRDGVSVDAETDASTGVPNDEMLLFTDGTSFSTNQILFFAVLNMALSDAQATQISGFINTFATYIGQHEY